MPHSGVEDVSLVALRQHIQELHAESEDLLSPRAMVTASQIDTLIKLCTEKTRSSLLVTGVMKLAKVLAESCAEREKLFARKQATEDAVAAKPVAEKRDEELA